MDHASYAKKLFEAARGAKPIDRFTASNPGFALADAYKVQKALMEMHLASGEKLVGRKMGLTSRPKMQQMGVHAPIHGFLTSAMRILDSGEIPCKGRIHPRAEPEIAFVIGKQLHGRVSPAEALAHVEGVCGAIEIIDSRYTNFDFQLPDVVADNGSSTGFVLGSELRKPGSLDLGNLGILLELDGKPQQFGSSAAVLGHPGRALAALAALMEEEGKVLEPGTVVLAGAATAAISIKPGGWLRASFQGLGSVEARVVE